MNTLLLNNLDIELAPLNKSELQNINGGGFWSTVYNIAQAYIAAVADCNAQLAAGFTKGLNETVK